MTLTARVGSSYAGSMMTRQLSNRVWLAILALSVGVVVACSSSTTTTEEKDSGAVTSSNHGSTSGSAKSSGAESTSKASTKG